MDSSCIIKLTDLIFGYTSQKGGALHSRAVRRSGRERVFTMLKKTITFNDFEGNEITREYYFNLNKSDMIDLQGSMEGGLDKFLINASQTKDVKAISDFIRTLIMRSYGEKGDDGISFIKVRNGEPLGEKFVQTLAYEKLYDELISGENDAQAFKDFFAGIVPADLLNGAKIQEQKFLAQKNS